MGVVIEGALKESNSAIKEVILTDVCLFAMGTDIVVIRENGHMESGHFYPIIERNTTNFCF